MTHLAAPLPTASLTRAEMSIRVGESEDSPTRIDISASHSASHSASQPAALGGDEGEPLPLPPRGWGVAQALEAVAEARLALPGLDRRPVVVSALTTVVLRCGRSAVKVYPPGTDPAHLEHVAAALAGTSTALLPSHLPVVTSWGVVVVHPWLGGTAPVDWAGTGALLRRFHDDHADAGLPAWVPLRRVPAVCPDLPDDVAGVLLDARAVLLDALAALDSPLGVGAVHGDVSPGNVLRRAGRPVLIDLDFAARGPREYDLTSAARRFDAREIDAAAYLAFCRAYGADVRGWPGRVVLDRIAALGGVAFRAWDEERRGVDLADRRRWWDEVVTEWTTPLS